VKRLASITDAMSRLLANTHEPFTLAYFAIHRRI
jgi:hypothetical protein